MVGACSERKLIRSHRSVRFSTSIIFNHFVSTDSFSQPSKSWTKNRISLGSAMCVPHIILEPSPHPWVPSPLPPRSPSLPPVRIVTAPSTNPCAPLPPRIITRAPRRSEISFLAAPLPTMADHAPSCAFVPEHPPVSSRRREFPPEAPTPPIPHQCRPRSSSSSSRSSRRLQEVNRRLAVLWRAMARIEREKERETYWLVRRGRRKQ